MLVGAVASTNFVSLAVLYEYSLVGEVRYSIKAPHNSDRPAMEMIIVPLSINIVAVGVCRVQVVPDPVYCAMLVDVVLAVSVIQIVVLNAHTNPNGLKGYDTAPARVVPVPADVGGVNAEVNEFRPPVDGVGELAESVYISAVLPNPHPIAPTL